MTCEEMELAVLEPERSAAVEAHLATCASCRAFAAEVAGVSAAAALPELSARERQALESVAAGTLGRWQDAQRRPAAPRWVGYLVAAGLGALVTGLGFWAARPVREVVVERVVERPAPVAVASADTTEPNLAADDVFFDVTWPDEPADPLDGESP